MSHREYTTGFYFGAPGQYYEDGMYSSDAEVCAVAESGPRPDGKCLLTQRNKFSAGELLELLTPENEPVAFTADGLEDENGVQIACARHPMMPFYMPLPPGAGRLSIIRKISKI